MKLQYIPLILFVICILTACQSEVTSPSPGPATLNTEITLAPGQSAVTGTNLTVTFHSVVSDDRCPSDVECVASGPVTVSLSVQDGDAPNELTLQTFTDLDGHSPNVQFGGVTNRAEVGDYVIQLAGVSPYPTSSTIPIKATAYRIALLISNK
jgi:hypothetical protein